MLILTEQDIRQAFTMKEAMKAVTEAFLLYESGVYTMPARLHIENGSSTFLVMPCGAVGGFGTKVVSVSPNNASRRMPVTQGLMILGDSETGTPLALLNGTELTAMRTGAVGGVGVDYLAPPEASRVAVIGAGAQGLYQVLAVCEARKIRDVYIYTRTPEKIAGFISMLEDRLSYIVKFHIAINAEEAVQQADMIITATTSADPVLPEKPGLYQGKLIVGVGSFRPEMREFPQALFKVASVIYVDTEEALHETGDVRTPLEKGWITEGQVRPLCRVVADRQQVPVDREKALVFKSVGMALFDTAVAHALYRKAKEAGIGQSIKL